MRVRHRPSAIAVAASRSRRAPRPSRAAEGAGAAPSRRPPKARWKACWSARRGRRTSPITVTVVSDAARPIPLSGRRSCRPAAIRSTSAPKATCSRCDAAVDGRRRQSDGDADLQLAQGARSRRAAHQYRMAESIPGTDSDKKTLLDCMSCHTLERIVRSTHDADEFMRGADADGELRQQLTPLHPQLRVAKRTAESRSGPRGGDIISPPSI